MDDEITNNDDFDREISFNDDFDDTELSDQEYHDIVGSDTTADNDDVDIVESDSIDNDDVKDKKNKKKINKKHIKSFNPVSEEETISAVSEENSQEPYSTNNENETLDSSIIPEKSNISTETISEPPIQHIQPEEISDIWQENGSNNVSNEYFEAYTGDNLPIINDNTLKEQFNNEDLSNAQLIPDDYSDGKVADMNGETPLIHSITDEIKETVTPEGIYEDVAILPSSNDVYDSRNDTNVTQSVNSDNDYNPIYEESLNKAVINNGGIISSETNGEQTVSSIINQIRQEQYINDYESAIQNNKALPQEPEEVSSEQIKETSVADITNTRKDIDAMHTNEFNITDMDKIASNSEQRVTYTTGVGIEPETVKTINNQQAYKQTLDDMSTFDEQKHNIQSIGKSFSSDSNTEESKDKNNTVLEEKHKDDISKATDATKESDITEKNTEYSEEHNIQRQFTSHIKGSLVEDLSSAGNAIIQASKNNSIDGNSAEGQGYQQYQKFTSIVDKATDILGNMGAGAAAAMARDTSYNFADGAITAEKLIKTGNLTQQDLLLSKPELKEKLDNISSLNKIDSSIVLSNREAIHNAMVMKEELIKMRDNAADPDHLFTKTTVMGHDVIGISEHENKVSNKILDGAGFYNTYKSDGLIQNMTSKYFAQSDNAMLSKINPTRLNIKDLQKLVDNAEKYNFSATETAMLKNILRNKQITKDKNFGKNFTGIHGIFSGIKGGIKSVYRVFRNIDSDVNVGLCQYKKIYTGGKAVASIIKYSAYAGYSTLKLIGKIPPVKYLNNLMRTGIKKKMHIVGDITKKSMKHIGDYAKRTTAAKKLSTIRKKSIKTLSDNSAIKTVTDSVKTVSGTVKTVTAGIANSRFVKLSKLASKRTRQVCNTITKPFKAVNAAFAKLNRLFKKIGKYIAVFVIILLLIVLALIMISAMIQSLTAAGGAMLTSTSSDEDIQEHVTMLKSLDDDKYQKAIDIAKKAPAHDSDHLDSKGLYPDEAYDGVHLYHYGSPKSKDDANADIYHNDISGGSTNGYHIYYLDSEGNVIGNNTTNVKDIESLATVMIENNYDYTDSEKSRFEELLKQWSSYLNPEPSYTVSDLYHKEGSDKFPYDGKTSNGKTYYCNDQSFYDSYNEAKSEGVNFYNEPVEQTDKGCEFDEDRYNADMDAYNNGDRDKEPNKDDYYYCPGHDALDCSYGYRDVNIYVTVLTKDDVYAAYANGKKLTYKTPKDYKCTSWDTKEVDLDFSAYSDLINDFNTEYTDGFGDKSVQEWVDNIYNEDWYDYYGVDGYSDSVSLPSGEGVLSDEQIQEIMDSVGDISEARTQMVNFALENVSKISYYWGGKAKCAGFDGNDFGKTIKSDYKGRNKKGLDCSGFVSWVYWSVTGYRPHGQNTSNFTKLLGLQKISANQLKPGDVGLESTPGSKTNHIGIFVGYADNGRAKWVHCEGAPSNTVVCNTTNCFKIYYKIFND